MYDVLIQPYSFPHFPLNLLHPRTLYTLHKVYGLSGLCTKSMETSEFDGE